MGPLLFCLALDKVVQACDEDLVVGYLDDLTIGGDCQKLLAQVPVIEAVSSLLGLRLNHSKCEFVGEGNIFREGINNLGFGIPVLGGGDVMLFGSPLTVGSLGRVLEVRRGDFQRMTSRLHFLSRHEGLLHLLHLEVVPLLPFKWGSGL